MQDLRSDAIVAQVVRIAEPEVGFHGIQTLFLKFVGLEFCRQSDAAALLPQVEQDASFLGVRRMAVCSWLPQSQRREPKTSPVRHSLCTRTSVGLSGEISP